LSKNVYWNPDKEKIAIIYIWIPAFAGMAKIVGVKRC